VNRIYYLIARAWWAVWPGLLILAGIFLLSYTEAAYHEDVEAYAVAEYGAGHG
jgi:hypothetical protein